MKESCWEDCMETNSSIKITPDKAKAKSLIETANGRMNYLKEIIIKKNNANYIFESYYTSILEILHALITLKGYKVQNHICLGYYLKDELKRNDLFRTFDDLRYKRNSLTYYGKQMEFKTAKDSIEKSIKLIKDLQSIITI